MVSLIIPKIIILLIIIFHALYDAFLIKKNQNINHILHSIIITVIGAACIYPFIIKSQIIKIVIFGFVANAGLFDFILNIIRGKNLFYISPNVNNPYSGPNVSFYDTVLKNKANFIRIFSFILTIILFFI